MGEGLQEDRKTELPMIREGGGSTGRKFAASGIFPRWLTDQGQRFLTVSIPLLSLFLIVAIAITFIPSNPYSPFSSKITSRLRSFFLLYRSDQNHGPTASASNTSSSSSAEVNSSRMAVCLVGGARRFELTGPSIMERILKVYPEADLFLHSPFDKNSFKLLLLRKAPRIAWVRIFQPQSMPETEPELRVLTASGSPNGIQGLLQYFNLVEGCLTMIKAYQEQNSFKYDWIVRTRVDGFWNAPLGPEFFLRDSYLVPPGSSYGGLNDRLGIGDMTTSVAALSRLSLIPQLDAAGFRQLNSETSFRAQLTTQNVSYVTKRLPFCIVTDRKYSFPPFRYGVPVAAMSSPGPLSGAKCRPCTVVCKDKCVADVMSELDRGWSWTDWENGTLRLCDAHGEWESGWERIFDRSAGRKLANERRRVWSLTQRECVEEFEKMRRRSGRWEAPTAEEICKLGSEH
ncbi:hypothetical protein SAY86_003572 [Trapa natans]|uniref:DUF7796 domain-containing protein n=1 Tax=Trapa natans TaxID=22666 RepID=A0AAN7MWX4_TRANT|nr:hypothetical protein SAY86_003572 [Trapa natans]